MQACTSKPPLATNRTIPAPKKLPHFHCFFFSFLLRCLIDVYNHNHLARVTGNENFLVSQFDPWLHLSMARRIKSDFFLLLSCSISRRLRWQLIPFVIFIFSSWSFIFTKFPINRAVGSRRILKILGPICRFQLISTNLPP